MKYRGLFFWLAVWIALFAFLQTVYEYHFYNIEQNQLFLFAGSYFSDMIWSPGGLSLYISDFLLQFFIYPYAGALVTATLLTCIGVLAMSVVKRIDRQSNAILLPLLPAITLLFMHFNFNYFVQGTVAYGLMLLFYLPYPGIGERKWRLAYSLAATIPLFWWGGSVSILFVSGIFVKELIERPSRCYLFILPLAWAALLSWGSVRWGMVGEYRLAFLPDMYYHNWLKPDGSIYLSWICFPAIVAVAMLLRKTRPAKGWKPIVGAMLQLALAGIVLLYGYREYGDTASLHFKKMEYYARTRQWDKVIGMNKGTITNALYVSLLNMALAEKGELADRMFSFDQLGTQGLIVRWNSTHSVSMLLSDIYFTIGNVSGSRQMAFEANQASPAGGGTGRMFQRLVETNLIFGAWPVAEKYIGLLEKTLYYRDWASARRKFLYNDAEVENDPILGSKRKSLPDGDIFSMTRQLESAAMKNPQNRTPIQYLGAFCLLSKRFDAFEELLGKYYGTDVLPALPLYFQEAAILMSENDPGSWVDMGVSPEVIKRFEEYKDFILENRDHRSPAQTVKRSYGDTYWYYFMFKNI